MLCDPCGQELPSGAQFCSSCGSPQPQALGPKPLSDATGSSPLVLRPKFVPRLQFLGYLPLSLFLGFWSGGFFGGFSMVLFDLFEVSAPRWIPFLFFGMAFTFLMPALLFRIQRKTYAKTRYTFHADRLDYYEGFFSVEEKTIPLSNVTEVSLRKGGLQKSYGLGTVILSTPASSHSTSRARSGIHITDIEHPDQVYQEIKALVRHAQADPPQRLAA